MHMYVSNRIDLCFYLFNIHLSLYRYLISIYLFIYLIVFIFLISSICPYICAEDAQVLFAPGTLRVISDPTTETDAIVGCNAR